MHVHCCTLSSDPWPSILDSAGWSDCSLQTQCSYQGAGQWPQCCATATSRLMRWVADWVAPWKEYFSTIHLWYDFLHVLWGSANQHMNTQWPRALTTPWVRCSSGMWLLGQKKVYGLCLLHMLWFLFFFFFFQSSKNLNSKLNSGCQDQKEREMPHKLDCAKFYPSHYSCPFQFHFDIIRLSDAQNLMVITSIQLSSTQYNSASVSKEVQFRNGIKCMKSLK